MVQIVQTGLDILTNDSNIQSKFKGNIGLLCHSASIDKSFNHAIDNGIKMFGKRLTKIFGPQHGLITDVQDNMIESNHFTHPYYNLPVYSLYSETRKPTQEMLEGLDHVIIDLQDVGTRIYTYIYTMTYMLEACAEKGIPVTILDRPNPIGLTHVEGNILESNFKSFVGRHELPVRHALTMGEVAKFHQKYLSTDKCDLSIIEVKNLTRSMYFEDTKLPWVMPSPNLPTVEGCFTFVGTVLFEGTNISEGRGTTRPLEIIGHPAIKPHEHLDYFESALNKLNLEGFKLRATSFRPTFQKHMGETCGGYQIHITDREKFNPWRVNQVLCKKLVHLLKDDFKYKEDPYEYEYDMNPLDMINGTDRLRKWYHEADDNFEFLNQIESEGMSDFKQKAKEIFIYKS